MKFEVDTGQVNTAVSRMQELLNEISGERTAMFSAMQSLDGMWVGEAHDAFVTQYSADNEIVLQVINSIQEMIEKFSAARQSYDKCEDEALDIVSAVQI